MEDINNVKVIKYEKNDMEIDSNLSKSKENSLGKKHLKIESQKKLKSLWKYIVFPILGIIVLMVIIFPIIFKKPISKGENIDSAISPNDTDSSKIQEDKSDKVINQDLGPIEMENGYKIKTNVNDLKRIYINQKYYEDIKISGVLNRNLVDRKTNYDIYIISEIEASHEEINYYNKTYLCSISITSECVSSQDEYCLPKKLVDLNDQDYSHVRNLEEVDNLENIPLPICFFNITDNNVIKSISCHKNLSEARVNSIVLDLYFFRPPGIKRINKEEGNITITQYKDGNNEIIKETNGGACDVENSFGSFCTTELNTTKDSEGNLIAYDEYAFTNISNDEDNYYVKKNIQNF